ncbi:MAG: hypothetical protein BWY83_00632 [bacterium ADurb.Bin478]|nr:MAG: hypothetical protein BWY83_00632 [bacterium ADurb.Bin478]
MPELGVGRHIAVRVSAQHIVEILQGQVVLLVLKPRPGQFENGARFDFLLVVFISRTAERLVGVIDEALAKKTFADHHRCIAADLRVGKFIADGGVQRARLTILFVGKTGRGDLKGCIGGILAVRKAREDPFKRFHRRCFLSGCFLPQTGLKQGRGRQRAVRADHSGGEKRGDRLFILLLIHIHPAQPVLGVVAVRVGRQTGDGLKGSDRLIQLPLFIKGFADEVLRLAAPAAVRIAADGGGQFLNRNVILFFSIMGQSQAKGGLLGQRTGAEARGDLFIGLDGLIPLLLFLIDERGGIPGIVGQRAVRMLPGHFGEIGQRRVAIPLPVERLAIPVTGVRIEGAVGIFLHELKETGFCFCKFSRVDQRFTDAKLRLIQQAQRRVTADDLTIGGDRLSVIADVEIALCQ